MPEARFFYPSRLSIKPRLNISTSSRYVPLCYCFGFDEADVREEIARMGGSAIPQKIAAMVKQGLYACEKRNPSGACCLGEVVKTVTRLTRGGLLNDQPGAGARRAEGARNYRRTDARTQHISRLPSRFLQ